MPSIQKTILIIHSIYINITHSIVAENLSIAQNRMELFSESNSSETSVIGNSNCETDQQNDIDGVHNSSTITGGNAVLIDVAGPFSRDYQNTSP